MTTKAEVKRFVKPLMQRYPELVPVEHGAVLTPVRHFARYIHVLPTSSAENCAPERFVRPLYLSGMYVNANAAGRILTGQRRLWRVRDPADAELFAEVAAGVLDLLRSIDTPQSFIELEWRDRWSIEGSKDYFEIPHRLFNGELDRARELLREPDWLTKRQWMPVLTELGLWDALREKGSALPIYGRQRLAAWFKERERRSVEALKIGHLWIDEPIPVGGEAG